MNALPVRSSPPVVLIHGAGTGPSIWRHVIPHLTDLALICPQRPASGDLDVEINFLAPLCTGAIVFGVSGGATLGLELVARGVPVAAGVFHEPAAGSLAPGLLAPVAAAYENGGVPGFGRALYGESWTPADGPDDPGEVARELAMFRAFEPRPSAPGVGPVLLTVGADSPAPRQASVQALAGLLECRWESIPGGRHAVHLDAPNAFAATAMRFVAESLGC